MGLFSKNSKDAKSIDATSSPSTDATEVSETKKKSLYQRYQEARRGPGISNLSDEELKKHIGMDRAELKKYSDTTPGVAGGQAAGSITAGGTNGFGLEGTAGGLGGWGPEAGKRPAERLQSK